MGLWRSGLNSSVGVSETIECQTTTLFVGICIPWLWVRLDVCDCNNVCCLILFISAGPANNDSEPP